MRSVFECVDRRTMDVRSILNYKLIGSDDGRNSRVEKCLYVTQYALAHSVVVTFRSRTNTDIL